MAKRGPSRDLVLALAEHAVWSARDYHSVRNPKLWGFVCSDEFRGLLTAELIGVLDEFLPELELELALSRLPREVQSAIARARRGLSPL